MNLRETFKNPTSPFRGKPFWSWNGDLDPAELRRQLRVMKRMGMGGAFLHSRVGLATPYLGKKWFECIRACIDECRGQGMEAWLYDEDRWPSGPAGGLVTKDPAYQMRYMRMDMLPPEKFKGHAADLAGVWEARLDGIKVIELAPLPKGKKPAAGKDRRVLTFQMVSQEPSSWYNGYTYLDTLSDKAVAKFIEVTHEAYRREVGEEFGGLVPGIFTDEPNYNNFWFQTMKPEEGCLFAMTPWTPKLPQIFKQRYGADILKSLPELFFNIAGIPVSRARYQYRDCITYLFVENFSRQIGEWCGRNKIEFTGHILMEDSLRGQTMCNGSAQRHYEYMQAPGIDILTEFFPGYDTAKQCASVVNQMGHRWMLSELYGCTGWDFGFEGHKAIGDWQAALGVNLRCPHLSWYTMKGEAKRDYPASIFFQSPWWDHYNVVEDYFSRVNVALTEGKPVRRLLVVHPVESMWVKLLPLLNGLQQLGEKDSNEGVEELDKMMPALRDWLLQAHLDFDYGDEEMLGRLGGVRRGKDGVALKLAKADYDAVLVPPQVTIRATTLKLLQRFQAAGGTVVFAGAVPAYVDALASEAAQKTAASCLQVPFKAKDVVKAVEAQSRFVSIQDAKGKEVAPVLYMLRRAGQRHILFLCNTDRTTGFAAVNVSVKATGRAIEWDPMTGEEYLLDATRKDGWVSFGTSLPASGSRLVLIDPAPVKGIPRKPKYVEKRRETLKAGKSVQLTEPNVLVLDRPRYRIGGGKLEGPLEILKVDAAVRQSMGIERRSGMMVQPWARKPLEHEPSAPLELRYAFAIEALPRALIHLVLETPERFSIRLNGQPLQEDPGEGWWVDPCLRRIRVDPAILQLGKNEIVLNIAFKPDDGLEAIFLTGDFGVRVEGTQCALTPPVETIELGDWVNQGLPFYGGTVTYRFKASPSPAKGERVVLSAPEFKGSLVRVLVDGQEAGFLPWPPYELDITPFAKGGEVEIGVQVIGSRRNAFGPLHLVDPKPQWTGPDQFTTTGKDWQEDYHLKPCGLLKSPTLSYRAKE